MSAARQYDLFTRRPARARYPHAPGHRHVRTQVAAAERIEPVAAAQRDRVLKHIAEQGAKGATRQETADALGMKLQSVCGRVRELVLSDAVIEPGPTRNGGKVVVVA